MFVKWKSKNNSSYEYVSLQDATKLCSYSQEYLSLRARQGKLKALKLGRNWVTKKEWLKEYVGKAEEYNNYINGRIAAKQAISPSAPDNLPIEKFRLDLSLRNLRPVFAFALVFILLTAGGVFGKESLLKTYHDVSPYIKEVGRAGDLVMEDYRQSFAAVSKDIGNMADDAFVAAVHYRNGLTSVSGIVGDYGNWLKENYFAADKFISQQVVQGIENMGKNYSITNRFIEKKVSDLVKAPQGLVNTYAIANKFVKDKINTLAKTPQDIINRYFVVNRLVEQQVVKAVGIYSSAEDFITQQIAQGVKNISQRYSAVDNFVEQKIVQGVQGIINSYVATDNFIEQQITRGVRSLSQNYGIANNLFEQKILEIVQGTAENFKEGVEMALVEGREIREKITETWQSAKNFVVNTKTKISNSIKESYQLVTRSWKGVASISDKFREMFDKEPLVIKSTEVSEVSKVVEVVEKEKEITREVETVKQITITKIDDEALKQVREDIAYLETEIGKRLYAPGGIVSQTIYMTEPVSSPKIYQENGEIVLQTLGSGNVILTAATGLQLYGQQVVIDSSSILNPMIYLADNTKIDGTLTAGNTNVETLTAGTTGISGNLTLSGGLTVSTTVFGTNGVIRENPSSGNDALEQNGFALDSSYIYIAGYDYAADAYGQWRIEKRDITTGALVSAFGTAGVIQENPTSNDDAANSIAIDSNYIYVAGYDYVSGTGDSEWRIEKRDITTGALVSAFGTAGVIQEDISSGRDRITPIAVDSNYIYVAGRDFAQGATDGQWRIEKRDITTGALVSAFGTAGVIQENPSTSTSTDFINSLTLDSSYIYLAGYDYAADAYGQWRIEKRDITTGALVSAFDTDGIIQENPSANVDIVYSIQVDSSYVYLAGQDGNTSSTYGQWRIEKRDITTGALVSAFGTAGVIQENSSSNHDASRSIKISSNSIYIAGYDAVPAGDYEWRIEKRDKTNGNLDIQQFTTTGREIVLSGKPSSSSITEGTIYYDNNDYQLMVYANSKWQADRSTATKIVAASNSSNKEKADYVADGTNDEVEIQNALDTLYLGGKVVLLEGTYNISNPITIYSNIALEGLGVGTIISNQNTSSQPAIKIQGSASLRKLNIIIRAMKIAGNLNSGDGIYVYYTYGYLIFEGLVVENNGRHGIFFGENGSSATVTGNRFDHNTEAGVYLGSSSNPASFRDNVLSTNKYGFRIGGGETNTIIIDGGNINASTLQGVLIDSASKNITIRGVHFEDNASSLSSSDNDKVSIKIGNTTTTPNGVHITNSWFNGNSQESYGIRVYAGNNINLENNQFRLHTVASIRIESGATGQLIGNVNIDDPVLLAGGSAGFHTFLESGGNIGISTTTPRYKLDVWGDLAIGTSTDTNTPVLYVESGNGGRVGIGTTTLSGLLTVGTTTPALVVAPNSRVGIASSTPSDTFAVQGNILGVGNIVISGTIETGQGATELYAMNQPVQTTDNVTFANLTLTYGITSATGTYSGLITATGGLIASASSTILGNFSVEGDATTTGNFAAGSTLYVDQSNSRVGIATTSPRYKLDVWGDLAIGTSTDTNTPVLYVESGNGGRVGIGTTTLAGLLTVGTTTPALVVDAQGYVGIATTSPSYQFAVQGRSYFSATTTIASDLVVSGAMKNTATKIVAASDTPNRDARADYVADGTADEVEIQAAIDSLPSSGGSVVLLEGTFNISSPIYTPTSKPLMLIGQGMGEEPGGVKQGTMLRLSNGANSSMIVVNNTAHTYFLTIKNLTLNGNKNNQTATSYGIEFKRYISDIVLENIYIFGFYSDAIHVAPTTDFWNLWLDSVLIENNSGWGLYLDNSANVDLNNVFINNSWFYRDTEGEIFAKNLEKKYWSPSSLLISDTMFASRKHAIQLQGSKNLKIVGNSIRDRSLIAANTYDAILLEDSNSTTNEDIIIQGNEISGGADQFRYGINMSSTTRSIVTNNQISGFGSHGIVLASSSDNIISQNIIYDNGKAAAATYDGIFVDDNSDYNNIQANVIRKGSGNTHRYGIRINSSDSDGNRIINNDLRQAGGTANLSDAGTLTEIIGNRTSDAGGQEITISGSATALTVTQSGTGDILNLFDGSTEVFTVLDGGNVGIGTTNPSSKLTVFGGDLTVGGGDATTTITNGQIALDYGISAATGTYSGLITATGGLISSASSTFATDLNISNNATTTGYFSAGGTLFVNQEKGRVGIATSTPRYTLDIWGDLAIGTSTDTNTPVLYVESGNGGRVGIGTTTLVGLLTVGTTTPALVVAQNGFVGIASSTPSDTFAVQGNILGVGNIVISGTIETGQGATELYAMNQPVQTTDNVTFANLTLTYGLTSATGTYSGLITATGGFVSSASSTILGNFSVEGDATTTGNFAAGSTLYVDQSNSRVGIATTTPRYKLDIWGNLAVGTTTSRILEVNSGEQLITAGVDLAVGSLQVNADSGAITFIDMSVTSAASAGVEESYSFQIDSSEILKIYAEADGSGGIQNRKILMGTTGTSTAIGIGTTTPYSLLSVWGGDLTVRSTGTATTTISSGISTFAGGLISSASSTFATDLSISNNATTTGYFSAGNLLFVNQESGNVGIGTTTPDYKLDVAGTGRFKCASTWTDTGDYIECADIAELYSASENLEYGDVVIIDSAEPFHVRKANNSNTIIGIVSTAPALVMRGSAIQLGSQSTSSEIFIAGTQVPIALAGRVPVKVSFENGPIAIGDALTSASSTPGVAMKATVAGRVIGMALEPFNSEGIGKIMVFVNPHWQGNDLAVEQNSSGQIVQIDIKAELANLGLIVNEYGVLEVGKLKTQELCVGSVCVTEEDFMRVFGDATPDTGAVCQNGANRPCGTEVGACQIGVEICEPIDTAQGRQFVWGECIGAAFPTDEICDEVDNDCDGETDEGDTCLGAGEVVPPAGGPTSTEPIIEPDISTSTDSIATTTEEII